MSFLLPQRLALDLAHPSAKVDLVQRVLELSPSSTHAAASLVNLLLTWASRALLYQHPRLETPLTSCLSAQAWSPVEVWPLGERKMGELRGGRYPKEWNEGAEKGMEDLEG